MTYLRIRNFWDYQNADAWKKAEQNKGGHRHPAWCKLVVRRDMQLDMQPVTVRLVFFELLRLATVYSNAIPNESEQIAKQISLPSQAVRQAVAVLLKGGWLQETRTPRRSRAPSRELRETRRPRVEAERTRSRPSSTSESDPAGARSAVATANGAQGTPVEERAYYVELIVTAVSGKDEGSRGVIEATARSVPGHRLADIAFRAKGQTAKWAVKALADESLTDGLDAAIAKTSRPDIAAVVERTARELGKRGRTWDDVGDFVDRLLEPVEDEDQRTTLRELAADAWQEARDAESAVA